MARAPCGESSPSDYGQSTSKYSAPNFSTSSLRFTLDTLYAFCGHISSLPQSCPKNGDIPKFPFPTVAAVAPSAGTITL